MKKTVETIIKFLIYATFFVPLVVVPSSFIFPFIVPKILLFRSLVALMLGGYVILLVINWREYRPRFSPVNLIVAAFLASFAISTFTGVDSYHSFWDNHERMLGLFTIFHYVAYYFICNAVLKNWQDWQIAMRVFLIAGSMVMIVGLLQVGNPNLLLNQGGSRVASTLGNPIYVGGYSLFLCFLSFLLIVREKILFWRWLEIIMGFLSLLGIFFSGTRGSMLGLVAGIGVALISYTVVLREYPKTRKIIGGILILFVALIGVLYIYRQTSFVSNIPAVGRTLNTPFTDLKNSPRWIAWQIAVRSWKERPIFGWGPNNYFYAFNKYYNPRSLEFGYGETWFDNAHNIIVNTLAVQGAVGIIIYLAMFFLTAASLWHARKKRQLNYHMAVVGTAFLAAHLVGNITVFENPTSYLYFMFWLAFINKLTINSEPSEKQENNKAKKQNNEIIIKPDRKISYGLIATVSALALILVFIFNIQPARANGKTLQVLRTLSSNPVLAVSEMKEVFGFSSPHIDDIRSDIGRTAAQVVGGSYQQLGKDRSNEILQIIYPELKKNLTLHPLDIRNQLALSQLAEITAMVNNSYDYIAESENFLVDALSKSPKRQQIIYTLANVKMQLRKNDEAIKLLEQAIKDNIKISESYWRLAYVYNAVGKQGKAKETVELARKNNIVFNEREQGIIGQILTTSAKK